VNQDELMTEIAEAVVLLKRLDDASLRALGRTIWPGLARGEAGQWSVLLFGLIDQELDARGTSACRRWG